MKMCGYATVTDITHYYIIKYLHNTEGFILQIYKTGFKAGLKKILAMHHIIHEYYLTYRVH